MGWGLRIKILKIMGVYWKIQFSGGSQEKQYWGDCLKKGAWTICRFDRGLEEKEEGGVFKRGW